MGQRLSTPHNYDSASLLQMEAPRTLQDLLGQLRLGDCDAAIEADYWAKSFDDHLAATEQDLGYAFRYVLVFINT